MKEENDEITALFRSRLTQTEVNVRDGFWEELSQELPVACRQHRRLLFFRSMAAASVMLFLAAASAAFLYFSPDKEMEEAFNKMVAANGGQLDGDGIRIHRLPLAVEPVLSKPVPKSYGMLSHYVENEDSLSFSFSMSFSFSSTTSDEDVNRGYTDYWQAAGDGGPVASAAPEEQRYAANALADEEKSAKKRRWAVKVQAGMGLPAENGRYKTPVSVGASAERKLNNCLGIEAGLLYSNLRSAGQQLHCLGIPIKMNVTLADTRKVDVYATAGGIIDKCIAGAPDNSFKEEPIQLALTAGVGINYKLTDHFALFAEPGMVHYFKTDSRLATVRTKRPTNFNLLCGIRMTY